MSRECSWVVETKGDGNTSLKASEYPHFDPATFLVEVPREQDTRLHNGKDILATRHRFIDIVPRFTGVKFGELIAAGSVRQGDNILR